MRRLFLFSCLIIVTLSTWAVSAYRLPIVVTQSDGTSLTIIGHGNGDFSWITTTDGAIIIRQGDGFYVADIDEQGNIKASQQLAHNKGERNLMEEALISKQDKSKFLQLAKETFRNSARRASISDKNIYTPHMGNVKGIVILAEFSDTAFTLPNPKKSFEYYFNGEHRGDKELINGEASLGGSVNKYFTDCSFGKFSPTFDVYGPVKLNNKHSYYGGKGRGRYLVKDACLAADDIIDFSKKEYDSDGDGYVDFVCVVFAGYSSSFSANPIYWIWPASHGVDIGTFDGAKVYRWLDCNELNGFPGSYTSEPYCRINGIGLFCHEFSHCLGLPDLYPRDGSVIDNQEMELWDLMDFGEYLSAGNFPPPYTAWERETMGWMKIDTLTTDQKDIEIEPIDYGGKAYRFMNPNDATKREYFLMENIQNKGWNYYQKGHGLLVYHVNYKSDIVNVEDYPNNENGKPRMAIVPADGWLMSSYKVGDQNYINPETGKVYTNVDYYNNIAGDPFPGTHNVSELKYDMNLPNYKWQIGDPEVKQAIVNIRENTSNGKITFDFVTDITNAIDRAIVNITQNDDAIYTIDGRKFNVNDPNQLPKGIYIKNNKKFIIR